MNNWLKPNSFIKSRVTVLNFTLQVIGVLFLKLILSLVTLIRHPSHPCQVLNHLLLLSNFRLQIPKQIHPVASYDLSHHLLPYVMHLLKSHLLNFLLLQHRYFILVLSAQRLNFTLFPAPPFVGSTESLLLQKLIDASGRYFIPFCHIFHF